MEEQKKCKGCLEYKTLIEFDKHPQGKLGRQARCKPCRREHERKRIEGYGENREFPPQKKCRGCKEIKNIEKFNKASHKKDGHSARCRECDSSKAQERYHQDPERYRNYQREARERNPERYKEINRQNYLRYAEDKRAYANKWRQENPEKHKYHKLIRQQTIKQAKPHWARDGYIKLWYQFRKVEEERIGEEVVVDHIVPLQNELVCGLHNEFNLQLLTKSANSSKSNHWWPNMPDDGTNPNLNQLKEGFFEPCR